MTIAPLLPVPATPWCSVVDVARGFRALADTGQTALADGALRRLGLSGEETRGFLSKTSAPRSEGLAGLARLFGRIATPTRLRGNASQRETVFLQPLSLVSYRSLAWFFDLPFTDEAFPPEQTIANLPLAALPRLISLLNVFLGEDVPLRVPTLEEALEVLSFQNMMNFSPPLSGNVVSARCLEESDPAEVWGPELTLPVEIAKKRRECGSMRGLMSLSFERFFLAMPEPEDFGMPMIFEASLQNAVSAPYARERFRAVPQPFPRDKLGVPLIFVR